ncbi:hypothetical protein Fcan01_19543 [Folsomia candida]|uniref:ZP domain-containing protein n=1 Tax=Folsomia candida TaxID=158441 RepID=A0A226DKP8_FOLCA|nr:hypothetical protein Fcan01_19543 [Folsomia candida]
MSTSNGWEWMQENVGADISTAQVGDPLSLRFEIAEVSSPYEIFVRELIAMDGSDGAEIVLIDSRGCPTDPSIMGPVTHVHNHGKILQAFFEAFKFPTSEVVQFQALVTPCLPTCQPVDCSLAADPSTGGSFQAQSYGRRRRRSVGGSNDTQQVENVLVINSIRIADRFKFQENNTLDEYDDTVADDDWEVTSSRSVSGQCLNFMGFLICCAFLVVLQVGIIFAWLFLWRRKQALNKKVPFPESSPLPPVSPPSPHYFYATTSPPSLHLHHQGDFTTGRKYLPRLS